ncbi:MAG: putative 2-dehydropantoate 2-reductase [Symploca sp. SIO3C6]|nr:putative 2-dehydropantoate 2-reductase [Symploca sp. SIO3C6]NET06129.1 putative 2-dehydropantoate 2-reductase [Symploca sp. SIO2B6]
MGYSYAVLGTGAVGGFYGARLQQAGFEVHFLLRSDYAHVREFGLKVKSIDGDFNLPQVNAYNSVEMMPSCDVVLLSLKATHNYLLPQLIPPLLKPDGIVLVLQNGLYVEEQVASVAKIRHIIAGLCFVCSNKIAPGEINHLHYGKITLIEYAPGYRRCGVTTRMEQIAKDFTSAGIAIAFAEDLLLERWQKLLWNIPFNGLSVVLNANTQEMLASPEIRQLVLELMQEVATAATACGLIIPKDLFYERIKLTEKMKSYRPSMKIDYENHRSLEVEAIFGAPLRIANKVGIHLPRIAMLYRQLQFLDAQNTLLH